jgi:hypothetical protein
MRRYEGEELARFLTERDPRQHHWYGQYLNLDRPNDCLWVKVVPAPPSSIAIAWHEMGEKQWRYYELSWDLVERTGEPGMAIIFALADRPGIDVEEFEWSCWGR